MAMRDPQSIAYEIREVSENLLEFVRFGRGIDANKKIGQLRNLLFELESMQKEGIEK